MREILTQKFLNISCCSNVTNTGLQLLTKLSNLETLDLRRCFSITDECLRTLCQLPKLSSLSFKDLRITLNIPEFTNEFTKLTSLTNLTFGNHLGYRLGKPAHVYSEAIWTTAHVHSCIKRLDLFNIGLDKQHIPVQLETLYLEYEKEVLPKFPLFPRVKYLSIDTKHKGNCDLSKFPNVEKIWLRKLNLTSTTTLETLKSLKELKYVHTELLETASTWNIWQNPTNFILEYDKRNVVLIK
jgi:hypothetical protein